MPYTKEQIRDYAYKLEKAGASSEEIEQFVSSASQDVADIPSSSNSPSPQPQTQDNDFFSSIRKGIDTAGDFMMSALNPAAAMQQKLMKSTVQKATENFSPEMQKKALEEATPTITKGVGDIASFLTDATLKPITKGSLTASIGPLVAEGKQLFTGSGRYDPIEIPGIGDINPNTQTPQQLVGTAIDTASGAANILAPAKGILGAGVRGGVQAGAKEAQDKNATTESILTAGVIGGVFSGASQGLLNKFSKWLSGEENLKSVEKEATKAGFKPDVVERIKTITPEERVAQKDYLDLALENIKRPDDVPTPMEKLANDVTDDVRVLYSKMQEVGKKIGDVKQDVREGAREIVDMNPIKESFLKDLDDTLRVKLSPINEGAGFDFSKSKIKNLDGDKKMLVDAWDSVKKAQTVDDLMVARDTLRADRNFGRANQQITVSEAAINNLDEAITKKIHEIKPDLAEFDDVFSSLRRATEAFQQKTGGKMAFTVEDSIDGTNTFNILRRSLGAGNNENKKLLEKLQVIGQKYQLPSLSNVMSLRRLAQTAEDIAGTDVLVRQTSLAGRAAQAGQVLGSASKMDVLGTVKGLTEIVKKQPKQVETFLNLLNRPLTPNVAKSIISNPIMNPILESLKVSLPQILAAGSPQQQ